MPLMILLIVVGLGMGLMGCASPGSNPTPQSSPGPIEKSSFGELPDGTAIDIYTLRNAHGVEARIMTYGGIVVSLRTPDRNGTFGDVVLGYETLDGYLGYSPYFGALIGRYGNRIAKGKFTLDGHEYSLALNNGPNLLHGGNKGFDKVVWRATPKVTTNGPALQLDYLSKDGEEGFPGNLSVTAIYTLTEDNSLRIDFTATTDKDTICNLTQHSYFNLRHSSDILGHEYYFNADKFTPVDATLIPTGELRPVDGTPFDFRQPTPIRERIKLTDEQLKIARGYDQNFVLNKPPGQLGLAARVYDPETGRVLEVSTTEPGIQFYTGNFLDGHIIGKGGWTYEKHNGFCIEPQHFPDSPNHPEFPSVVLRVGDTYKQTTIYHFSTR